MASLPSIKPKVENTTTTLKGTTIMAFAKPAPSSGIKWEDLKGALLVVEPLAIETGIKTQYGESDAVKAHVHVLDGDKAGTSYPETLIFPKVLQTAVRSAIGEQVLGRLGQGQAKPGQSKPWVLEDPTDADMTTAEAWEAENSDTPF